MIDPHEIPRLWLIAHDRTEIPAGEFLEELAELDVLYNDAPIELTQQTLSNYVKRRWVPRQRVGTAPGGRGQTGYFQRRALVAAVFAREFQTRYELDDAVQGTNNFDGDYAVRLLVVLVHEIYNDGKVDGQLALLAKPFFDDRDIVLEHLRRAQLIRFLALIVDVAPEPHADVLRAIQAAVKTEPVTGDLHRDWGLLGALEAWLTSKPTRKAKRAAA